MHKSAPVAVSLNYVAWGLLPLFWKLLDQVDSTYVLAHRIIWATVFSGAWLVYVRMGSHARSVFNGVSPRILFSSVVIAANWGIYIWAVNTGFVTYAALGYFVAPLLSVLFGLTFFREFLSWPQWIAIGLTAGGALLYGWGHSGVGILIVFGIGFTFSIYSAIKKTLRIGAVSGLFAESGVLAPVALVLMITGVLQPTADLDGRTWVLLILSGLVTLVPLVVLSYYSRAVPLSTLGMLQFILPTVQLVLGIAVFNETVSGIQLVALSLIAAGVTLYFTKSYRQLKD